MTTILRMGTIRATGMGMGMIRVEGTVYHIDVILAFCTQLILVFG
jgi:hypothetical protein